MKVVKNSFKKKLVVKNSFIEKTYVVGTHRNCLIKAIPICTTTYVTENKEENYLEIYIFQVSCPLSLPLLPIGIKIPVTLLQIVYICMTAISPNSSS